MNLAHAIHMILEDSDNALNDHDCDRELCHYHCEEDCTDNCTWIEQTRESIKITRDVFGLCTADCQTA